ncbi:unnamed protein product [Schistocephalus solidus]|uniref:HAUS augmin-like complex subunit 5 n=1 Tax=Schistocephalus solidus TaxID=70667 RepID=A0A183SX57_SCHSO|nr:unnamed protein product [Schistocephalus solidus]
MKCLRKHGDMRFFLGTAIRVSLCPSPMWKNYGGISVVDVDTRPHLFRSQCLRVSRTTPNQERPDPFMATDLFQDSVASAIFHDADSHMNYGVSLEFSRHRRGLRKSVSVPNLLGESSNAGSCLTSAAEGCALPEGPSYEYRAWQALAKFALKARDKSVRTEESKRTQLLTDVETLEQLVARKRQTDAWLSKWLIAQRAIDTQIKVLSRLEGILKNTEPEDQPGLIALLRKLNEAYLLPARQRLPASGLVYASEEEVVSAAKLAKIAHDKFASSFTGDLQVLRDLSGQLMKVLDLLNSQSSLCDVENYAKLKEAFRLLTYLVSLKTQKLQSKLLKGLTSSTA